MRASERVELSQITRLSRSGEAREVLLVALGDVYIALRRKNATTVNTQACRELHGGLKALKGTLVIAKHHLNTSLFEGSARRAPS